MAADWIQSEGRGTGLNAVIIARSPIDPDNPSLLPCSIIFFLFSFSLSLLFLFSSRVAPFNSAALARDANNDAPEINRQTHRLDLRPRRVYPRTWENIVFTMPDQIACTRVYRVPVLRPSSFPCAEGFTAPDPSHANAPQRDCLSVDHANNEDTLLIGRSLSNDDSSSFEFL